MLPSRPFDDENTLREFVFDDAPERVRDLIERVSALDSGLALLRFLHVNANSLMTIDDLAYHLQTPQTAVASTLSALLGLGLVQWVDVAGLAFFGITSDPDARRLADDVCHWQDRWHTRLEHIERLVDGAAEARFSVDPAQQLNTPRAAQARRI